ncbi:AMP-binding protein [candidate division KSB1 bacterium]|nr:AMP-binding protein [candidate division KSB1 bacterium]
MPDHTALVFGEVQIDYRRLSEAIRRLANGLRSLGVQRGDRVAILLPNVPHFVVAYYAALALGAVAVPLNFMMNGQELQRLLQDSGARVLIAWDGFRPLFFAISLSEALCPDIVVLGEKCPDFARPLTRLMQESSDDPITEIVQDDNPAAILYTAGTAHDSYGALMSHQALQFNAQTSREMFRVGERDRIAAAIPLYHPLAQSQGMNLALLSGAVLVLAPRIQPRPLLQTLRDTRTTFLPLVPGLVSALTALPAGENPLSDLRAALCYGSRIDEQEVNRFESICSAPLFVGYGLTEAGPLVSCHRLFSDYRPDAVGPPLVGIEIQILDENSVSLAPNCTGEIWIKSPSVMSGYHNRPQETAARMRDDWFFTGDIGYIDLDHYLYVVGRKEDLIYKSGFPVFPHEIEDVLSGHPAVDQAAVIGVETAAHQNDIKAFVVLSSGQRVEVQELIDFCRQTLPVYKCPTSVEFCSLLPRSATGRILKRLLH